MNLVYAGTPVFAVPTLAALCAAGHQLVAVYTQPDRPAGRGRKLTPSPVKEYALSRNLPVYQPSTLREYAIELAKLKPDAMIVVAYGLILPAALLAIPKYGCINVHASLLPRWRGAAPIARAIEAGDTETGITIMQMEAGLDTGPILTQVTTAIAETDTTSSLESRMAQIGADALVAVLMRLDRGELIPRAPQDNTRACYAPKLHKNESPLDWSLPAIILARKIRALNPWPVATTTFKKEPLRLWDANHITTAIPENAPPGTIMKADAHALNVCTGNGLLTITRLQAAGGKVLSAPEFLNGVRLKIGDRLGT